MSAAAILRSRTTSPSNKLSSTTTTTTGNGKLLSNSSSSSRIVDGGTRQRRESVSPESRQQRAFSPTNKDMNRVHEELEKLNIATDVINKLELQLDQARETFREIQTSWTQKLEQLSKKLGACIDKSRPYYEARMRLLEAQQDAQRAALRFERANSLHAVAKQQVALTQDSLNRQQPGEVDPACLEVLNHHIQRVNEAERERLQSEDEHRRVSLRVEEANRRVLALEKELKRSIQKSKSYFEARVEFTKVLDDQKALIQRLEAEIKQKKHDYNTSLRNLERISEEIHERRQTLGPRDPGVGSETPDPPPSSLSSTTSTTSRKESRGEQQDDQKPTPVVYLRRQSKSKSKSSTKVDELMEILGAKTISSTDGQSEEERRRAGSMPPDIVMDAGRSRLNSGVILLAQQLLSTTGNSGSNSNGDGSMMMDGSDRKSRAFTFPPEQLDLQYKTIPEGVKPFPTPPETPATPPPATSASIGFLARPVSDTNLVRKQSSSICESGSYNNGFNSESSSVSSFALDDEQVERIVMRSPFGMIKEIDSVFDRVQNQQTSADQSEEDSGCSIRTSHATTASLELPEGRRSSASGAEDP